MEKQYSKVSKSIFLLMIVCVIFINGCSTTQGYTKKHNRVVYSEPVNDTENPIVTIRLDGVDPVNFEIINDKYGKYENDIYFRGKKLRTSNPLSLNEEYVKEYFETVVIKENWQKVTEESHSKSGYIRKNNNIYWEDMSQGNKVHLYEVTRPDADTFITSQKEPSYGKDRNRVYKLYKFPKIIEGADPFSFEVLGFNYGKDKDNAYFYHMKIADTEISSFQAIGFNYAKDDKQAYYQENPIKYSDPYSFKTIGTGYAKDKSGVYCYDKQIPGSDPETFTFVKKEYSGYAKDKKFVYWLCQKIDDAEPETFQVTSNGEAQDKNNRYYDGKRII